MKNIVQFDDQSARQYFIVPGSATSSIADQAKIWSVCSQPEKTESGLCLDSVFRSEAD
ncbi:MAG: hypothetical protein V3S21_01835 [Xanthomonadales bacterium]